MRKLQGEKPCASAGRPCHASDTLAQDLAARTHGEARDARVSDLSIARVLAVDSSACQVDFPAAECHIPTLRFDRAVLLQELDAAVKRESSEK